MAEAAEASMSAATAQADIAAASAQTAQTAAHAAQQAVPDNLLSRLADAEVKNTQQDTRLNGVESGITAVSTTLIGSIMSVMAAEGYVPNGTVPADAAEYTREQFREFYDTYLAGGKLLTCTYAAFAAQVALTGNCAKFALDTTAQKFKVPLLKNGDSITQAASASELGKSYKAGLPSQAARWDFRRLGESMEQVLYTLQVQAVLGLVNHLVVAGTLLGLTRVAAAPSTEIPTQSLLRAYACGILWFWHLRRTVPACSTGQITWQVWRARPTWIWIT